MDPKASKAYDRASLAFERWKRSTYTDRKALAWWTAWHRASINHDPDYGTINYRPCVPGGERKP